MMKKFARFAIHGLIVLLCAGCDDGNSDYFLDYNLPLEWRTDFHAEWLDETSLQVIARVYPYANNSQRSGLEAEIVISGRQSEEGEWQEVHRVRRTEGHDWSETFNVEVPPSEEGLRWYRIDTRIYLRKRLEASYTGPVIVTGRPMLRPATSTALPDLVTSNTFRPSFSSSYAAPAVSPDGRNLFVGDAHSRLFSLSTGQEMRLIEQQHLSRQVASFWEKDRILLYGNHLSIISVETLTEEDQVNGDYSFRRSDSEYVVIDRNSWLIYNPVANKYKSVRAEFQITSDENLQPTGIFQRPGVPMYISGLPYRLVNAWWLRDAQFQYIRPLGPIDDTGLQYNASGYYSYYSYNFSDSPIIWLDKDRLIAYTYWSGEAAWWLCNIAEGTYAQVTGYPESLFTGTDPDYSSSYYTYTLFPAFDRSNNRLLVFYPITTTKCAVRALPIP